VEKQAKILLLTGSARRGPNGLPDDFWIKISVEFFKYPEDAVYKWMEEKVRSLKHTLHALSDR
jgi:predicted ATP-dependent Lon-type protease